MGEEGRKEIALSLRKFNLVWPLDRSRFSSEISLSRLSNLQP